MAKRQKLQGGYKKQLEQLKEQSDEDKELPPSNFALILTQKGGWGKLSAPELQELAFAAHADGLRHPEVEKLASIGAWGKYPANMQRDLLFHVEKFSSMAAVTTSVDLKLNVKGTKFTDTTCTFILPHKLFSTLFNFKHTAFGKFIVGGDVSNIKTFWTTFQDHPLLTARPVLKGRKDLSTKVIPLGIHGDGVQYMQIHRAGGKGLDVLSWSSLLTKGPTKLSYWIMFLVVKSCVKIAGLGCTWVKVWKVLAWSFEALAKGKWPQADWEGQPFAEDTIDFQKKGQDLADGYCGVILLLKADLEFLASHFQLNHTSSNFPCCLCKADRQMTSRPWTDCRLQAAWRETSWTKDSWDAEHPDCHPFFRMCDNGIDMVYPDLMHSKHLGTDQVLLGSILSWLSKSFLPDTAKNNLEYVWDWIKDWQKDSRMHGRATPHRHSKMILLGVPTTIWLSKEKKREGTFSKTKGLS